MEEWREAAVTFSLPPRSHGQPAGRLSKRPKLSGTVGLVL